MYLSKKATMNGVRIEGDVIILGPTTLGQGTLIGAYAIIGYPMYRKIREIDTAGNILESYDEISEGTIIGKSCVIRSHTVIYEKVKIGNMVQTGHSVLIRENTEIGDRSVVGTHSIIDGDVKIGKEVSIQSGSYIPPKSIVGNNVFLAPFVVITNDKYPASKRLLGVMIEDDAIIGANSVLISGVKIGRGAVVASGAIVTRDIPPNKVVLGAPARVVMSREEYERKKREYELKG